MSVASQTRRPDKLIIYDDNDKPIDLRTVPIYRQLFSVLDDKKIEWGVVFGDKKGQSHNHQRANMEGFDAVWRIDDDCFAEPDVLEKLEKQLKDGVGAVGSSILTPPVYYDYVDSSNSIYQLDKPNKQWFIIKETEEVDHLHCSFLYRAGIVSYDLRLSKKCHREETMFSYSLKLKGYKIIITPGITWHFKSETGGIRSDNNKTDYEHDEKIFRDWLFFQETGKKLYVLNCGVGDNYMFLQTIELPKNAVVATCYPWVYEGMGVETISIADAKQVCDIDKYDIYKWCIDNKWKGTLIEAYKKLYENINS
jgi:hypothetical protein